MLKEGYDKEVCFHLPGAFSSPILYNFFLRLYVEKRYVFYDNAKIGSLYGSPGCKWNGGRLITGYIPPTVNEINDYRDFINEFVNLPIRFTWTNSALKEIHLHDELCNLLADSFNNGKNEIICNSPLLEEYLRNKYKDNYKYISSTTKCILKYDDLINELDKYYLTVLDYRFNNNFDFLEKLPNKEKIEILCNAVCKTNCPCRSEHYKKISIDQLSGVENKGFDLNCPNNNKLVLYCDVKKSNNSYVSPESINNLYIPMGFKNFKLEGRTHNMIDVLEILIDYLIKDEWKMWVREIVLINIFNIND